MAKRERSSKPRLPHDPNLIAARVLRQATEPSTELSTNPPPKDPLAVELGRRGGLKGGKARAAKLSARKRAEIARRAAAARWKK